MNFNQEFNWEFVEEFRRASSLRVSEWPEQTSIVDRLSRWLVQIVGHFAELDYSGNLWNESSIKRDSYFKTKSKLSWWSNYLFRAAYFVVLIRCLINCFFQYQYDFSINEYSSQLIILNKHLNSTEATKYAEQVYEKLHSLANDIDHFRDILKTLGAPFINLFMISESITLLLCTTTLVTFMQVHLYFRLRKPYDLSIMRSLLDRNREQLDYVDDLVLAEVEIFISSICSQVNLFKASAEELERNKLLSGGARLSEHGLSERPPNDLTTLEDSAPIPLPYDLSIISERPRFIGKVTYRSSKKLLENLRQIACRGYLNPFNKNLIWLKRSSKMYATCLNLYVIFDIVCLVIFVSMLERTNFFKNRPLELESRMDYLGLFEFFWLCWVLTISVGPQLVNMYLVPRDQIYYSGELCKLIRTTILINKINYLSILREYSNERRNSQGKKRNLKTKHKRMIEEMNLRFLHAYLQFKIFVRQFRPIKVVLGWLAILAIELYPVTPILVRLHNQYLDESGRMFSLIYSVSFMVMGAVALIPMTAIHAYSIKLHKLMQSLMVHAVEVELVVNPEGNLENLHIYNTHLIWLMRKELREHEQPMASLSLETFGIRLTYPNYLKLHFYCGLLILTNTFSSMQDGICGGSLI